MKTLPNYTSVRQLRKLFFDNNFRAVLFADELTNEDVRRALFNIDDQDKMLWYKMDGDCVLIWEKKPVIKTHVETNKRFMVKASTTNLTTAYVLDDNDDLIIETSKNGRVLCDIFLQPRRAVAIIRNTNLI